MPYISIGNAAMPSISTVETRYTGAVSLFLSLSLPPPQHTQSPCFSLDDHNYTACSKRRTDMQHLEYLCIFGVSRMVGKGKRGREREIEKEKEREREK